MKKIFKLEGLDCLSCASRMESDIGNLDGVYNASVNFFHKNLLLMQKKA